jgi:hypothetical protein
MAQTESRGTCLAPGTIERKGEEVLDATKSMGMQPRDERTWRRGKLRTSWQHQQVEQAS